LRVPQRDAAEQDIILVCFDDILPTHPSSYGAGIPDDASQQHRAGGVT